MLAVRVNTAVAEPENWLAAFPLVLMTLNAAVAAPAPSCMPATEPQRYAGRSGLDSVVDARS